MNSFIYDPLNRLIEKIDPFDITVETLEYNHNGAQVKSYDTMSKLTEYTYDKNNRLLSTEDACGHMTSQAYDDAGHIATKTDGENNTATYSYDEFNRLISVVNALSETTNYTYDNNGNMLTQTDGEGNVTTYEYNVMNLPTRKINDGGRTGTPPNYTYDSAKTESYTYTSVGNLATKVDRNGVTTTYTYDCHSRLLSTTAGSITISYTYDANGNQLTMTDSTGTTTRTYDQLSRVKTKTVPGFGAMTFQYDVTAGLSSGQVKEIDTDSENNVTSKVYDKAGRMISVSDGSGMTTYSYYDNGSKHFTTYPDGSTEEYIYYDNNLLHSLTNKKADQSLIDAYTYTYDEANNQLSKIDSRGTTTYTYDALNRLATVTEPSGQVTTYTYDAAGNRVAQTVSYQGDSTITEYTYNTQNRLTDTETTLNNMTTETVEYTYDNNGNELTITTTPYVNGIPQTPSMDTNTFDVLNRLTITAVQGGSTVTNTYNGDGLRVKKQVGTQITKFLYEGDDVVLELDGSGNQTARNVWGTSLISRYADSETLYYMYNGHGDVTEMIDSSGTIANSYYYDAFGTIVSNLETADNPFKYAGYYYDAETKDYYLMVRFYDPATGRFLSEDSYSGNPSDPLSLNLYTYCHNEPLMYIDPTGYSDQLVRDTNESVGNTVAYNGSNKTITITTYDGYTITLKEGVDYYLKGGKAYYINDPNNGVRALNNGSNVQYHDGYITIDGYKIYEGEDYYIGDDGKAYYYSNVRMWNESQGNGVDGSANGKIKIYNPDGSYSNTLKLGRDYYIGADGSAHFLFGPPAPTTDEGKDTTDPIEDTTPGTPTTPSPGPTPGTTTPGSREFVNPLEGDIVVNRGYTGGHTGIDYDVDLNQEIIAVTDGVLNYKVALMLVVVDGELKFYFRSYGKYASLTFEMDDVNYEAIFAHMNQLPAGIEKKFAADFQTWALGLLSKQIDGKYGASAQELFKQMSNMKPEEAVKTIVTSSFSLEYSNTIAYELLGKTTFTYGGGEVEMGDVIGYAGTTGKSSGTHLHFEIKKDGEYINPGSLINDLPYK